MTGIKEFFLELLFPVRAQCLGCGDDRGCDEPFLCDACQKLKWPVNAVVQHDAWLRRGLDSACFAYRYARPVSGLIRAFKYNGVRMLVGGMADDLSNLMKKRELGPYDAIVPIPLHPARRRKRGFNQAEVLAEALSVRCGIPVETGAISRIRNTRQQARLSREKRNRNTIGAFSAVKDMSGMKILLLDDVITTGSTMCACAEALKEAGAERVDSMTVAGAFSCARNARHIYRRKK